MDIKKLRVIRKGLGLSLGYVSDKSGVDKGALSLIENGKGNPTIKTLEKIVLVLGVRIEILL